jgi:uroporphyrinogen decarboxylase
VRKMTSRERVLAVLNHQEPDRVPLDVGGGSGTSIIVEGYEKLKRYLGITAETRLMNEILRTAEIDEKVMEYLGCDCRPVSSGRAINSGKPGTDAATIKDAWGITWKKKPYGQGFYYEVAQSPLEKAGLEDLQNYPWPDPYAPGLTQGLKESAKRLYEQTSYAVVGDGGFKNHWEVCFLLRGLDQILMDLLIDPDFVRALLEKILEINLIATGRFLEEAGPYIHIFKAADDLGMQQGLMMSPDTYRSIIKPIHKRYFDFVKSKTKAKIFFHSCGNIGEIMADLVEAGVDIINPVQVSAMPNIVDLKKRFGDRVVFWGAIDTQKVLPYGSPKDVEQEVRKRIDDLAAGGGYVVAAVHSIQADVPPENIVAMAEATRKYGIRSGQVAK